LFPSIQVALSEFCITPSEDQTLKFDVKAGSDAITLLFTDSGTSGFFYEIVIGGNGNVVDNITSSVQIGYQR
jgi:hypothetical protein